MLAAVRNAAKDFLRLLLMVDGDGESMVKKINIKDAVYMKAEACNFSYPNNHRTQGFHKQGSIVH